MWLAVCTWGKKQRTFLLETRFSLLYFCFLSCYGPHGTQDLKNDRHVAWSSSVIIDWCSQRSCIWIKDYKMLMLTSSSQQQVIKSILIHLCPHLIAPFPVAGAISSGNKLLSQGTGLPSTTHPSDPAITPSEVHSWWWEVLWEVPSWRTFATSLHPGQPQGSFLAFLPTNSTWKLCKGQGEEEELGTAMYFTNTASK